MRCSRANVNTSGGGSYLPIDQARPRHPRRLGAGFSRSPSAHFSLPAPGRFFSMLTRVISKSPVIGSSGTKLARNWKVFFRSGLERGLRRDGVVKAANDLYSVRRIFPGASIVRSCVVSSTSKFTRFFPDLSAAAAGYSNRSCKIYLRSIGLGYPILYFLLLLRAGAE